MPVLFLMIPLSSLTGVMLVNKCPLQPNIPIFLIVSGLSVMLKTILLIVHSIILRNSTFSSTSYSRSGLKTSMCAWSVFNTVFNLFLLAWTIAGSCWVYGNYREVIKSGDLACNKFLYKFTFTVITSSYILLLLLCCACLFVGTCYRIGKRSGVAHSNGAEGTSGSDWILAHSDVIAATCNPPEDRRERTNEEDGASVLRVNLQSSSREVPVSFTPVCGLASNRERATSTEILDIITNIQADSSTTLPLDSELEDGRTRSVNQPIRSSSGASHVQGVPARMMHGSTPGSHATHSLRRLQQAHSNSGNLGLIRFRDWNSGNDGNSNGALQNTSSYVNLLPMASVRDTLTASSEYAQSNPILYDSHQQFLPRNADKLRRKASGDHNSVHLCGNLPQHHRSGTNMREAKSNSSILYTTVLSDGFSTTHV